MTGPRVLALRVTLRCSSRAEAASLPGWGRGGGGGRSPEDAACEEDTGTRRCSRKGGVQGTAAARGSDGQVQRGSEHRRGRGRRVSHGTHSREGLSWLGRTGYDSVSSS